MKTSGSKGFPHRRSARRKGELRNRLALCSRPRRGPREARPGALTQEFIKADRGGRILLDTGRNGLGATFAAPYAVRGAAPRRWFQRRTWEELESGAVVPQSFTLRTLPARLEKPGDLLARPAREASIARRRGHSSGATPLRARVVGVVRGVYPSPDVAKIKDEIGNRTERMSTSFGAP